MNNVYEAPQADLTPKKQKQNDNPITQAMIDGLANGRKWAMFLAVVGYIQLSFIGLMMLTMLFTIGFMSIFLMLFYGPMAFLIFKFTRCIHLYSSSVKEFEERGNQGYLMDSQEHYTSFIKWIGILLILLAAMFVFTALISIVAS